jgi:hypothetical protein
MAGINISIDASGIGKMRLALAALQGQLPYAASRALNDAAKQVAVDLNKSTLQYFDKGGPPTRFTQNAYRVSSRSNKTNLVAEVRPKSIQERYLLPSIRGGVRPQRPSERRLGGVSPAYRPGLDARLNDSGNMSKAAVVKALKGGDPYFRLGERRGKLRPGIYQRMGSGTARRYKVKSILLFNKLPNIPRRWPIDRIAKGSLNASWTPLINRYLAEALRTAK